MKHLVTLTRALGTLSVFRAFLSKQCPSRILSMWVRPGKAPFNFVGLIGFRITLDPRRALMILKFSFMGRIVLQ